MKLARRWLADDAAYFNRSSAYKKTGLGVLPSPVFVLFVCPYATPTVMRMLAKVRCSPVEMASRRVFSPQAS